MNNLTVIPQPDNQYTLVISGMCIGKLLDWNKALLANEDRVFESPDGNWEYGLIITDLTATELRVLRGYDYSQYPLTLPGLKTRGF